MKLLVVIPRVHKVGGTERVVAEEISRFPADWEITVLTGECKIDLRPTCRLVLMPTIKLIGILEYLSFYFLSSVWIVLQRLKRDRFDIVYSPGINCFQIDITISHYARGFIDLFGNTPFSFGNFKSLIRDLYRFLYNGVVFIFEWIGYRVCAKKILCVSNLLVEKMKACYGLTGDKLGVIPNGVDCNFFSLRKIGEIRPFVRQRYGYRESDKVVLFIGNSLKLKGFPFLVEALQLCRDRNIFLFAVTNDDPTAYRHFPWIKFSPPHEKVLEFYSLADILVIPSLFDSFCLPALEAMACGIPTIVGSGAGVVELLDDGIDALVVQSPKNPDEIWEKIKRILNNPELAKSLSTQGRKKAEALTWERHTEELVGEFDLFLKNRKAKI